MKKAITILAVLIVLVGAVFADETHSIKLKTVVDEVIPAFQLSNTNLTAKDSAGVAVANVSQTSNAAEQVFSDDAPAAEDNPATPDVDESAAAHGHTYTLDGRAAVNVGDLSKYDVTAKFTVYLANKAKTLQDYKLTFTAGAFSVKRNNVSGTLAASAPVVSETGAKVGSVAEKGTSVTTSEESSYVKVDFNGNECKENTTLAVYTVTYTHDERLDPSGANGYTADISLVVATL